jgi:hypothetical protein
VHTADPADALAILGISASALITSAWPPAARAKVMDFMTKCLRDDIAAAAKSQGH